MFFKPVSVFASTTEISQSDHSPHAFVCLVCRCELSSLCCFTSFCCHLNPINCTDYSDFALEGIPIRCHFFNFVESRKLLLCLLLHKNQKQFPDLLCLFKRRRQYFEVIGKLVLDTKVVSPYKFVTFILLRCSQRSV